MIKSYITIYPFYLIIDLIFIVICFAVSYFSRYGINPFTDTYLPFLKEYFSIFITWGMLLVYFFKKRSLYTTDRSLTIPKEIWKVVSSVIYVSFLMIVVIFFVQYKFFSRQIFLHSFFALCLSLSIWRIIKRLTLRKLILEGFHNINILMIGINDSGNMVLEEIKNNPWYGLKVVGFLDDEAKEDKEGIILLGKIKDFPVIVKRYFIDEVVITTPLEKKVMSGLINQARNLRLGIRIMPENFEESNQIINVSYLGALPLITYKERKYHPAELFLKRMFDVLIALLLLIILFPLFIIIAILIKIDSKGPILYIQKRVGLKGRIFNLYKFRSMIKEAEALKDSLLEKNEVRDGIIFKIKNDPRVTDIGMFLRKTSMDELPQLFDVLKGNMSLVGPRPPTPDEVKKYSHLQMDRLTIRPGITGLSQVKGRSELTFKKWVRWDIWYINNWSFILDLKILWWTMPVVFKGKGAY